MKKSGMLKMLKGYKSNMRFHTPGHKGKLSGFGKVARLDITELSFSDNALCPSGEIARLNLDLTNVYGAKAHVLCGGATSGIFVMLSLFSSKRVLLSRYTHRSVFNAMSVFNITPILIDNNMTADMRALKTSDIQNNICSCDAVLITYPDYYGSTCDIESIAKIAHDNGKALLVDGAHAAHFAYSKQLPKSPSIYADICVLSVHKTCMALTGSAVITAKNAYDNDIILAINKLCSTSPSYLLCCSIDISHQIMLKYYERKIKEQLAVIDKYRERLFNKGIIIKNTNDIARLVVDFSKFNMSGFSAGKILEKNGIFAEMCDYKNVVFILTCADSGRKVERLLKAICKMQSANDYEKWSYSEEPIIKESHIKQAELISLEDSVGRICADTVGLYPPGVPLLLPNEQITSEIKDILFSYGEHTFGIYNNMISVFKMAETDKING